MTIFKPLLSSLLVAVALAGCGQAGPSVFGGQERTSLFTAQSEAEGGVPVVLHFKSKAQLDALARAGVDLFENVDLKKGTVGALLTARTEKLVRQIGARYAVAQNAERVQDRMPGGYRTVKQIEAELQALASQYPKVVHLQAIGKSLEGRTIWAVNLTSKPGQKLPAVRLTTGVHARELPPVEVNMNLVRTLAEGYGSDETITRLLDSRDVWTVPVWNPDGRTKVEDGSAMWRKNTRDNQGVDINRNADDHWQQGSASPWAQDYRGAAPFSEPETQAVKALTERVDFKVAMDMHCYGGMVLWPPGFSKEYSKDEAAFRAIGERMAKPLGYKAGTIARTIYSTFGDFATWEYQQKGTLSFAVELDTGGFNPSYKVAEKQWHDWKDNLLFMIDAAGAPRAQAGFLQSLNVFPTR